MLDQLAQVLDSPEQESARALAEYVASQPSDKPSESRKSSFEGAKSRVSKSVGFGIVEQKEMETEYQAPSDIEIVTSPDETSIALMTDLLNEIEQNHETIINKKDRK